MEGAGKMQIKGSLQIYRSFQFFSAGFAFPVPVCDSKAGSESNLEPSVPDTKKHRASVQENESGANCILPANEKREGPEAAVGG